MLTKQPSRRLLTVILDGVGETSSHFGNAVALAHTPCMDYLRGNRPFRTIFAHGTHVGLPSDTDIGNSEVGHNTIGSGKIYDQGAKLVDNAIATGSLFTGDVWLALLNQVREHNSTLHFLGLLSDGNVHSHENHLHALIKRAWKEGCAKIRIHTLLDGRDVGEKSAEIYVERLGKLCADLTLAGCDIAVASGGGRMTITMDRYGADWEMVNKGWQTHVLGKADYHYGFLAEAIADLREKFPTSDQYLPSFVIIKEGKPVGTIEDGDGVVFFNFRGDRAIEISKAFTEKDFSHFDRMRLPKIYYAGMMQYDGDEKIPEKYLVSPPTISDTLGEYLVKQNIKQFACSETQKYGHVTFFWNGNRSGYFDKNLEEYLEIPSDRIQFDEKPWMKAWDITEATIRRMHDNSFICGRINYANGDMVGHTGNLDASISAVGCVDMMLSKLIQASLKTGVTLLITADHGNCEQMFDAKEKDFPQAHKHPLLIPRPTPKTSHTLSPVPLFIFDPTDTIWQFDSKIMQPGLANLANTMLVLMGLPPRDLYAPSLVIPLNF